jgi:hypothetical protein
MTWEERCARREILRERRRRYLRNERVLAAWKERGMLKSARFLIA